MPRNGIWNTKDYSDWGSGGVSLHIDSKVCHDSVVKPYLSATTLLTITDHNTRDMSVVEGNIVTEYEVKSAGSRTNDVINVVTTLKQYSTSNALPMTSVVRFRSIQSSFNSQTQSESSHYASEADISTNKQILTTLISKQVQLWKDTDYCFYGGLDVPAITDGTSMAPVVESADCTGNDNTSLIGATKPISVPLCVPVNAADVACVGETLTKYQATAMVGYSTILFPMSYDLSVARDVTNPYISLLPRPLADKLSSQSGASRVTGGPFVGPLFLPVHKETLSLICQRENEIMEKCAQLGSEGMIMLMRGSKGCGHTVPPLLSPSTPHLTHRLVGYTYSIDPLVMSRVVNPMGKVNNNIRYNIDNVIPGLGSFTQVTISRKLTSIMDIEISREVCEQSGTVTIYCVSGSVHKLYPDGSTATLLYSECLQDKEIYVSIVSNHDVIDPTPLDVGCRRLLPSHYQDIPELLKEALINTSVRFYIRSSDTEHINRDKRFNIDCRVAEEITRMKNLPGNPESSVYFRAVAASLLLLPNGRALPHLEISHDYDKVRSGGRGGSPSGRKSTTSIGGKLRNSPSVIANMSVGTCNDIHGRLILFQELMTKRAQEEMTSYGLHSSDMKDGEAQQLHYLLQETRPFLPNGCRRTAPSREFGPIPLGALPPYWLLVAPSGRRMARRGPWVFDSLTTTGEPGEAQRLTNSVFNLLSMHLSGDAQPLSSRPFPTVVPSMKSEDVRAHEINQCELYNDTAKYAMSCVPPIKVVVTTDVQNLCHIRSRSDGVVIATYNNRDLVENAHLSTSSTDQPRCTIPLPVRGFDQASEQGSVRVTVHTDGTTIISVLPPNIRQKINNLSVSIPTHFTVLEGFVRFLESNSIPAPNHDSRLGGNGMRFQPTEAPTETQGIRDLKKELVLPLLPHMVLGTVASSPTNTRHPIGKEGNDMSNNSSVKPKAVSVSTSIGYMIEHPRFPLVILRRNEPYLHTQHISTVRANSPQQNRSMSPHNDVNRGSVGFNSQVTASALGTEDYQNLNAPYDAFICFCDGSLLSSQVMSVVTAQPPSQVVSNIKTNNCTMQTHIITSADTREFSACSSAQNANSLIRQISFHRPSGTHVRILPTLDRDAFTKRNISFVSPMIVVEPYTAALTVSSPCRQLLIPSAVLKLKGNEAVAYGGIVHNEKDSMVSQIKATASIVTAAAFHEGCPVFKVPPTGGMISLGEVLLRIIDRRNYVTTVAFAIPLSASCTFPQCSISIDKESSRHLVSSLVQFVRYTTDDLLAMLGSTDRTTAHVVPKKAVSVKGSGTTIPEDENDESCSRQCSLSYTGANRNRSLMLNSSIENTLRLMTVPFVSLHGLISNSLVISCNKHRDGLLTAINSVPPKHSPTAHWGDGIITPSTASNGLSGTGRADHVTNNRSVIGLGSNSQPILEASDVGTVLGALQFDFIPFMFVVRRSMNSDNNGDHKNSTPNCQGGSRYIFTQILSPDDLVPYIHEHCSPIVSQDFSIYRNPTENDISSYDDRLFDKVSAGAYLDTVLERTMNLVLLGKTITALKTNVAGEPNIDVLQFYQSNRYAMNGDVSSPLNIINDDSHSILSRNISASRVATVADQPVPLHRNPFMISSWLPKSLLPPKKLIAIAAAATSSYNIYTTSVVTLQLLKFKPYTLMVRNAVVELRLYDDCQRRKMLGYMQAMIAATPMGNKGDSYEMKNKLRDIGNSKDRKVINQEAKKSYTSETTVKHNGKMLISKADAEMDISALDVGVLRESLDVQHPQTNTFDCLVIGAQNGKQNDEIMNDDNDINDLEDNEDGGNHGRQYPPANTTHTASRERAQVYLNQPTPWRRCDDLVLCPLAPLVDFGEIPTPLYRDASKAHDAHSDIFCYRYIRTVKLYNLINDTINVRIVNPQLKKDHTGKRKIGPITVIGGSMTLGPHSNNQFSIQIDTGNKSLVSNLQESLTDISVNEQMRKTVEGDAANGNGTDHNMRKARYLYDITEVFKISVIGAIDPIPLTVKCRIVLNESYKSSVRIRPDVKILPLSM